MTLRQQLWLAIAALMSIAFAGSFAVSCWSARVYLQEQLTLKNADNANALALSLATAGGEPVALELLLAAQYDTGNYAHLRLRGGAGGDLEFGSAERAAVPGVPVWLVRWFAIEPEPGVAQVSQGWQALGTLELQSESRFAYRELWRSAQRLFAYFALACGLAGLAGTLLLRAITRPLAAVVAQAKAIGERRFITIPEPRTREFNALSRAMNGLCARVQQLLAEESERLGRWHRQSQTDPVTGLLAREPFLERLASLLKREDASAEGSFAILRVLQLSELNRRHGRAVMDALLRRLGDELTSQSELHEGLIAGRLNGSELALAAPEHGDPGSLAADLQRAVVAAGEELGVVLQIAAAAARYSSADALAVLLQRTDQALAALEREGAGGVRVADAVAASAPSSQQELAHWSECIGEALERERLRLEFYPVRGRGLEILHEEGFCRLRGADGAELRAAQFMPWAARSGHMLELDRAVVAAALAHIARSSRPLAVNLSTRLLGEPAALHEIVAQVRAAPRCAHLLWLELPEHGVYPRIAAFRELCAALAPLGCRLGIEHAGAEVARMGALYDVGLHYVKLEAALTRGIECAPGNQAFVRGLCTIAHAIGLRAIAQAVESEAEWSTLLELGIDGGTGRHFTAWPPPVRDGSS